VPIYSETGYPYDEKCGDIMDLQNILKGPYQNNIVIYMCLFGMLIVILFATPLTILPCKDTIEELFLPAN
jgi:hypothetical protein